MRRSPLRRAIRERRGGFGPSLLRGHSDRKRPQPVPPPGAETEAARKRANLIAVP